LAPIFPAASPEDKYRLSGEGEATAVGLTSTVATAAAAGTDVLPMVAGRGGVASSSLMDSYVVGQAQQLRSSEAHMKESRHARTVSSWALCRHLTFQSVLEDLVALWRLRELLLRALQTARRFMSRMRE
jgi:hypothetical protein